MPRYRTLREDLDAFINVLDTKNLIRYVSLLNYIEHLFNAMEKRYVIRVLQFFRQRVHY